MRSKTLSLFPTGLITLSLLPPLGVDVMGVKRTLPCEYTVPKRLASYFACQLRAKVDN
jgi:hypothetical protein